MYFIESVKRSNDWLGSDDEYSDEEFSQNQFESRRVESSSTGVLRKMPNPRNSTSR